MNTTGFKKIIASGVLAWLTAMPAAQADSDQAKALFKAMSDNLAAQKTFSGGYDSMLEIVTKDNQKLGLASSNTFVVNRPDKLYMTRKGGFADVALYFDGAKASILEKTKNEYTEMEVKGTIDTLVETLRDTHKRPVPAADLIMANVYDELMPLVTDVKDLGDGFIHGVECDHLAFRTKEVDFEIWITQGKDPRPCRYSITSKNIKGSPSYTIDVSSWKTGSDAEQTDFTFRAPTGAKLVTAKDLFDTDELPAIFRIKPLEVRK